MFSVIKITQLASVLNRNEENVERLKSQKPNK